MLKVDTIIGSIAPHVCLSCGVEGSVLCRRCCDLYYEPIQPRCAGCHALSNDFKTCTSCRSWLNLYAVYCASNYEGIYRQLIDEFKFKYKRQASESIAQMLLNVFPKQFNEVIFCPIPTAPSRTRQRGFDHIRLLANDINKKQPIIMQPLLSRSTNARQLGASRQQRIEQMSKEFKVKNSHNIKDKTIILIDDVMTTGATLSAAANTLKEAGAKRVSAIIFSQKV